MTRWTRRDLCRAGAAGAALLLVPEAFAKEGPAKGADYAKDVEFLLDTLPKKASGLLRQKGVDWNAVEREFRAAVKAVKSDGEHLKLCARLVARLRDGHAGLRDLKVPWPDESKGRRWTGPRAHLVVAGDAVLVSEAREQAADAGLAPGDVVRTIDDRPARAWLDAKAAELRDADGYSTDQAALYSACHWGLGGWEGTAIEFVVLKGAKGTKTEKAKVLRSGGSNFVPWGPVWPPKKLQSVGRQSYGRTEGGFGYVHLRDVPDELPSQLDTALAAIGDVPGLVLDCRANGGGGCDHAAVFGRFVAPGRKWLGYASAGEKPFAGPMVVIVDAGVRSAGETISGQFKEDGRAYMIGDSPTAGMSAKKETVTVPSGLFSVLFAVATHQSSWNGGRGIEGVGIPPHEVVPYTADELSRAVDTQIRRADELLSKGFPKGVVRYEPGK